MAAQLMACNFNLYARALALSDRATESFDKRLDVCKDNRRKSGLREDRS